MGASKLHAAPFLRTEECLVNNYERRLFFSLFGGTQGTGHRTKPIIIARRQARKSDDEYLSGAHDRFTKQFYF